MARHTKERDGTSGMDVWLGQFCIEAASVQEKGSYLGHFRSRDPSFRQRDLYMVAEPVLGGTAQFCQELVNAVGYMFEKEKLSATGAIKRALGTAHQYLLDWNRHSIPDHYVAAGVSCLVLRGNEGYLAQAGPSLAYFLRDGKLERLCPDSEEAAQPVGVAEELVTTLTRLEWQQGDVLLMAFRTLADIVDEQTLIQILSLPTEEVIPQLYLLTRHLSDFAALFLDFGAFGISDIPS